MEAEEFKVTPWEVEGEVDYKKLIERFGTQEITDQLLQRIRGHAGELHPMLERRFFFSHRDFDWVLDRYEQGEKFYLYTGRGPSGKIHLGHLTPWVFTKWLQDKFDVNLLFQMTDDEKFLYHPEKDLKEIESVTQDNILDIIAVGFKPEKTEILTDIANIKELYGVALEVAKRVTTSTVKAIFGFEDSTNIGLVFYPAIQAAPAFLYAKVKGKAVPCLIPAAIDQDPYWRMTRDVAERLGYYKPAQIHSRFFPGLAKGGKMSSSKPETAIYTTDDPDVVSKKIANAFTGGRATIAEQRRYGANPDICTVFWYLRDFYEPDEKLLMEREADCRTGRVLCFECKHYLEGKVHAYLKDFQRRRRQARNLVEKFTHA